jgi:glycine/D-amino acid oxidase-like deaminating enzyme
MTIHRRDLIKGIGGALGALRIPSLRAERGAVRPQVIVIGAGIIGASIAYHLAKRGAKVTILERARPASGATGKSFAWINATFSKQPYPYFALNLQGIAEWKRLERELRGALRIDWCGSVEWYPSGPEAATHQREVRRHQQWGYPTHLIESATVRQYLPDITSGPIGVASFSPDEGTIDPVEVVHLLLQQAQREGARLLDACAVTAWHFGEGRRLRGVETSRGPMAADVIVLAAGTGIPSIAAQAGLTVPLIDSPGLLLQLRSPRRLIDRVVLAPGAHLLQRRDGRILSGSGFGGTPTVDQGTVQAKLLQDAAATFLPKLRSIPPERVTLGWRVMPEDELPIIGFPTTHPNLYLAAMHSGITLAPLIGRLAATEILDRLSIDLLAPFRLERF